MQVLSNLSPIVHWLPRLALAAIFGYHGLPKITQTAAMAGMMAMPTLVVLLIGIAEVAGAALILYGAVGPDGATRAAAAIFAVVMMGAIPLVHLPHGWNSIGAMGMEFQVLILAISLYFLAKGNDTN